MLFCQVTGMNDGAHVWSIEIAGGANPIASKEFERALRRTSAREDRGDQGPEEVSQPTRQFRPDILV